MPKPGRIPPGALSALVLLLALAPALARAQAAGTPGPAGVPVQVGAVAFGDVPVLLRNIGSVQALNTVLVRARVDGTIDRLLFTEGQDVKAGQALAQIDPRPYAAVYAAAQAKRASDQATLVNAQRDLARYTSLARSDFASRQQLDTQQATVQQTQAGLQGDDAQIASAQLNLDYATVKSPIDGRVGLRLIDPGNLVHATDATGIVTVTQIHPIAVVFTLPQETLPQVQDAMARGRLPVLAFAGDDRTQLGEGELLTIDNEIDQATGTIRLKATFPNADSRLWPGQFVNVRLRVATLAHVLVVPSAAVQHGPNGLYAFVVKPDQTVASQPIEVAQDDGHDAVVSKGLDEGAQVVVAGQSRLQGGTKVAITAAPANG